MLLHKRIRLAERLAPVFLAAQHLDLVDGAFDIVDVYLPKALLAGHQGRQDVYKRQTLHNVDIFRKLQLGIGDELEVYKANMIIPAVAKNLSLIHI